MEEIMSLNYAGYKDIYTFSLSVGNQMLFLSAVKILTQLSPVYVSTLKASWETKLSQITVRFLSGKSDTIPQPACTEGL